MFVATTLLYPLALALLCLGAGLLADRLAGAWLQPALLAALGAAALIAAAQLLTIFSWSAPATPFALGALALAGFALGRARLGELRAALIAEPLPAALSALAYLLAIAPVLLSGRPSFTSGSLSDPAVHMTGAEYLIRHGQSYGGLDLSNSYGLFIKNYYGTSYPSGADTLFGGTAKLLGLPLIWAYQPFDAFALALGSAPAWVLARRLGIGRALGAGAALTAVLPALVYGYQLEGSIKELTAMSLLLACGCLVAGAREWVDRGPRGAVPLALLFAAGLSALGAAFGAWVVASLIALAAVLWRSGGLPAGRETARAAAAGALVVLVAALPTWTHIGGAVQVASDIASTSNSGNLKVPLHAYQVLGVWLNGSFKVRPAGTASALTAVLEVLVAVTALVGAAGCLRRRANAVGLWLGAVLLAWLVISHTVTAWAGAKTLVLTSPAVMLLAWGGAAALGRLAPRALATALAAAIAVAILAGVLVSDELQYNAVDLAPTARYDELATIDGRFAGQGPALFTDFDEYALYALRDLDLGSPNFVYPSPALAPAAQGYGRPFALESIAPRALASYPLIVTRRDPQAPRPPAAYALARAGRYYLVWRRRAGARVPVASATLAGSGPLACARIARVARAAGARGSLSAALAPRVVAVPLKRARRPRSWGPARGRAVMKRAGTLRARFSLPFGGAWHLWLRGRLMPRIGVSVDGLAVGAIAGQVSGNSLITAPAPPLEARLSAGAHAIEIHRAAPTLAPGDRGSAVLDGVFLTPAHAPAAARLVGVPARRWRALCGGPALEWVEGVR
jgi:hypothetical protein